MVPFAMVLPCARALGQRPCRIWRLRHGCVRHAGVRSAAPRTRVADPPPSQETLRQRLFEVGAEQHLTEILQALRGRRAGRAEALALAEHAVYEGLLYKHRHFTMLMAGLGRRSLWSEALGMFQEMRFRELIPNTIVYNAAIDACRRGQAWHQAVYLLEAMDRRSAKPDVVSYSTAAVACEKVSEWAAALSLFGSIREASLQVDAFGVSAALSACGKGGQWALALLMLGDMESRSITPDLFCLNGALAALGKAHLWEEHLRMLQQAEGIDPDHVSYNTTISASAESSRWPAALSLFQEMQERETQPTVVTYNAVIVALLTAGGDKADLAEAIFAQMTGSKVEPNGYTLNSMICAQQAAGRWQRAVELLEEMQECLVVDPDDQGNATKTVIDILFHCQQQEAAHQLFRQAVADGRLEADGAPKRNLI